MSVVPHLLSLDPPAALPGGRVDVLGSGLGQMPDAYLGDTRAALALSRDARATVIVPEGAIPGELRLERNGASSNGLDLNVGVPLLEEIHPVANPAMDADGNLFVMFSGPRGEKVDISIYRIERDFQVRPFVRDLMNISALAFDREGYLYGSSRAEGTVYRISPEGEISTYAESMGIATGLAFDREGNLFVGDRSGTIFKIAPGVDGRSGEIFVFATLETSIAAYHLAFRNDGRLLVTAPTTSSFSPIYAIDPDGNTSIFYKGLGRPQGIAVDVDDNVYVAASLHGRRGIVRIDTAGRADMVLAGDDVVGLCFMEDGMAAVTTRSAVFQVELGVEGRTLV